MLQLLVERDLEKRPQKEFQLLSLVVKEKMTVAGYMMRTDPATTLYGNLKRRFFNMFPLFFF